MSNGGYGQEISFMSECKKNILKLVVKVVSFYEYTKKALNSSCSKGELFIIKCSSTQELKLVFIKVLNVARIYELHLMNSLFHITFT